MATLTGEMEVWQSNRLVEASQRLTLNEKRLVLAAAALHDPRRPLPKLGTVTVRAEDFAEAFDLNVKHVYETLADASQRLYNRSIKTINNSRGTPVERDVRWVWMAEYKKGEGAVTLGFSPSLVPYLTLLRTEFTRYKLKYAARLSSVYALRLYELCAQYRRAGRRAIPVQQMREMLDLVDAYPAMFELRRRVLDPAIAEINRHTDLCVVMHQVTKGRKVVGFRFEISQNAQMPLELADASEGVGMFALDGEDDGEAAA